MMLSMKWGRVLFIVCLVNFANCHIVFDLSSSNWRIFNANHTIDTLGEVPGGVYSMLEDKFFIADILYGYNDINYRWIGNDYWTYFREFELNTTHLNYPILQLVLHGIDTLAEVYINDNHVLSCNNMFVRYLVNVKNYLIEGTNNITIAFESPVKGASRIASQINYTVPPVCHPPSYNGECNINMLRKMQSSFGWDWGPAIPSMGIWKPAELIMSQGPVIRSIGAYTEVVGDHWQLNATVWFDPSKVKFKDNLIITLSNASGPIVISWRKIHLKKDIESQSVTFSLLIAKSRIQTWWPNGYGNQHLYKLKASYTHSEKTVEIGFRTIELIQENVSKNESQGKSFYFVVNGLEMFSKGSNWIPSHILPEKLSDPTRIVPLLEAAADAHFNMLRVWGGGVYESELFYETCNRLGILIWQDLMFACSMYPADRKFIESVQIEIEQQIKRLQHHPSIAIWAGNNENESALRQNWYGTSSNFSLYKDDYLTLYVNTIKPIVERLDPSRKYVTSSPSNGVQTEKEGYVAKNPSDTLYGDVHYYNYISNSWDYRIYPKPRFASEYGVQSFPNSHCLRPALPLGEMKWQSQSLEHRQHAVGGNVIIMTAISQNLPSSYNIDDIIYLSQINQAMAMKTESEKYRRLKSFILDSGEGYTMGALYWQLNDIWQAPSWASIDYCGNWKMIHYFAKEFFAPIIISPELSAIGDRISLYVVVDGKTPYLEANISLNVHQWSSSLLTKGFVYHKPLVDNKSSKVLDLALSEIFNIEKKEDYFFTMSLDVNGVPIAPDNYLFLSSLNSMKYPKATVKMSNVTLVDNMTVEVTLTSDKYALFVWLEAANLKGVFSKNGFHMFEQSTKVLFKSKNPLSEEMLNEITVTWLKQNYS